MSSKTTSFILLKSQKCGHVMPAGAFGAVRPVGAILPTATAAGPIPLTKPRTATPRWGYPSHPLPRRAKAP